MRILYLEDEPKDAELVQATLEAEGIVCDVTRIDTESGFHGLLEQGGFDLLFADYTLPMFDGISALRMAQEVRPEVPFIFVSGTMGEDLAIEALKQGATDYVFKTRLSRIAPSVRRAMREAAERSQRRQAEDALKRNEAELQKLVDFVPQVIVVVGPDGRRLHANQVARDYTGLTLEEYRSVDVIDRVIHPDDADKMRAAQERGVSTCNPFELEARLRGKDGIYRWFLFRYNPLVEEGRVRRWYATATEIDLRKQEEERVRKENVRLEERTIIAQEIHDTLLQSFLGASIQLGAALDKLPSDSLVRPNLDRILQLMDQGIEEGRQTIQGLRSSDSHTLDLVMALSHLQQELTDHQPDIDFRVTVKGVQQPLWPLIRHEIYRIGREALVNAFRHSQAKCVEFELDYANSDLRMRVRDNGCGIEPRVLKSGREGHWGLSGMRERALRIGGLLEINSKATVGTEVLLSIPGRIAFQRTSAARNGN